MPTLRIFDVTTGEDRTQEYSLIGKLIPNNFMYRYKNIPPRILVALKFILLLKHNLEYNNFFLFAISI